MHVSQPGSPSGDRRKNPQWPGSRHYSPSATMLQCIDAILEESPKAIWATSLQFRILFVNLINLSFFPGRRYPTGQLVSLPNRTQGMCVREAHAHTG